jgi:hypothetical protein
MVETGMRLNLDLAEAELLITSLEYTRLAFEETSYPTYEMKRDRIGDVERIINRIREERKRERGKR